MPNDAPQRWTDDTAAKVALPPGKKEVHFQWDADRFVAVRVRKRSPTAKLKRTWFTGGPVGGRWKPIPLGELGRVKAETAYVLAHHMAAQIALGEDPTAKKRKVKAEAKALAKAKKDQLGTLIESFLVVKAKGVRPTTLTDAKYYLSKIWAPLHARPIDPAIEGGIQSSDISTVLEGIKGKSSVRAARSCLGSFYAWAIPKYCKDNPVTATRKPAKAPPRERVLSDAEIEKLWPHLRPLFRMLLLTGCRRSELGGLRWDEVSSDGVLTIPGRKIKSNRDLILVLPPAAIEILKSVPEVEGQPFVFGNKKGAGFGAWSSAKLRIDAKVHLPHWTFHDLRRSCRSGMSRLGVAPHIAELAIGHTRPTIQAIYDKHDYRDEVAAAHRLWADHVLKVVGE